MYKFLIGTSSKVMEVRKIMALVKILFFILCMMGTISSEKAIEVVLMVIVVILEIASFDIQKETLVQS